MSSTNNDAYRNTKIIDTEESKQFVEQPSIHECKNTACTLVSNEGVMTQVTHVYDDGAPYVRTITIDPVTRSLASSIRVLEDIHHNNDLENTHVVDNILTRVNGSTTEDAISVSSESTTIIDLTDPDSPYLETWRNLCESRNGNHTETLNIDD